MTIVTSFEQLKLALSNQTPMICVEGSIPCHHSLMLPAGTQLLGNADKLCMLSFSNGDGVGVSQDNVIKDLSIVCPTQNRAIYNTSSEANLGKFELENLTLSGQCSFIFRSGVKHANLTINNLDIIASDARHYPEQAQKYNVNALQGALTIFNTCSDNDSLIELDLRGITIGRAKAPVLGSGIFISGFGATGGQVKLNYLATNEVFSHGMIPFGIANLITAGIFISYGVDATKIEHHGSVTTYGVNDMVLDTWGTVGEWICYANVVSYGPSGVGFVNFGQVKSFVAKAPLMTYGLGARGYNQYDGTVETIEFDSITTYGDGSVGVQISKPIGTLTIHKDLITHGGVGTSLVKGVNMQLPAVALSIKEGGEAANIKIGGNITTHGDGVNCCEVAGIVDQFTLNGTLTANGKEAKTLELYPSGRIPLDSLKSNQR